MKVQRNIFAPGRRESERGFTILLAALVASLTLALGISVFTIAQKQLVLSSIGRNSQYAFYAADTAAECALYHEMRHNAFDITAPITPISCDENAAIEVTHTELPYPIYFDMEFEPNGYCARVRVTKDNIHPRTVIHADGFSVPCGQIETSGRVLQRSVEITF